MSILVDHVTLYDNQEFKNCMCGCQEKMVYKIKHQPQPLSLPDKMIKTIEMLLWYTPNNASSVQTFNNEYLDNKIFEDAIITYYLRYFKISPEDFYFLEDGSINQVLLAPYMGSICNRCQKIIVTRRRGETKITSIIKHLRNCLAHGNFNLFGNEDFIGFDKYKGNYTAVFKIKISKMYSFCKQLIDEPDFTISQLFQYIFLKMKYSICSLPTGGYNFTNKKEEEELVFAVGNGYAFRINCSRYTRGGYIKKFEEIEEYVPDLEDDFFKDVQYYNLFYCENEQEKIRKLSASASVISKNGLEDLFKGRYELISNLRID